MAASDLAAEVQAETKGQPPILFGIGGVVRADLTPPCLRGHAFIVGKIGHDLLDSQKQGADVEKVPFR